ncbi:MAG TPA: 50S ribosomal protein L10 [Candidatus Saccharimonadales bacterium]|nr:50S ribosomal protein L10 [Candidatus Saccharimonadales bacterium]
MALNKSQKQSVVSEVAELLSESKMTVVAKYQGTSVKALQELRRNGKDNGTKVKVIKNRLVKQALQSTDKLKEVDTSALEGMLLYAFNSEDEVAAAQALNSFIKLNPNVEFVGAISDDGKFLDSASVKELASLPGKNQLIAGLVGILNSPIRNVTSGLGGGLSNILSGLEAKAS